METISLFSKVAIPISGIVLSALIGGRLLWVLVKHFLIKYFENQERKIAAAFNRSDEIRADFLKWKSEEYRDAKRDFALELERHREELIKLFERTDNFREVQACVDFCNARNKTGAQS